MIRVNLLSRRPVHPATALLVMSSALFAAAVVLAGLYWVDQRYPLRRAWNELLADPGVEETTVAQTSGPASGPAGAVPEEDEGVEAAPAPGADPSPREAAGSAPALRPGAEAPPATGRVALRTARGAPTLEQVEVLPAIGAETAPGMRRVPHWSPACFQALALCRAIPSGVRFKGLTSNAAGEYTIEGLSTSPEAALEVFKDTLSELSQVSLEMWRGGQVQGRRVYKFTFQGKLEQFEARQLKPLSAAEAASLVRQVADWARESGLDSLSADAPTRVALGSGLSHQRQKIWARGSYGHITAFAERLRGVAAVASLGELVMIPVYRGGEGWQSARLYAVVDILVGHGVDLP